VIEDEIARRLHSDLSASFCFEIHCQETIVKIGNPRACATVDWKVCKSATSLNLSVIKITCNQDANKSNHPN
jgi:hypothetical protein